MPLLIDRDSSHLFYHTESVACRSQGSLLGSIAAGFSGGFRRVEPPNPDVKLPDLTSAWLLLLRSLALDMCTYVVHAERKQKKHNSIWVQSMEAPLPQSSWCHGPWRTR